jgi:hypothetical protein
LEALPELLRVLVAALSVDRAQLEREVQERPVDEAAALAAESAGRNGTSPFLWRRPLPK